MTKKLLTIVVVVILGWFGFLWYLGGQNLSKQTQTPSASNELVRVERQQQPDSDSDGLKDWEETLWQTDPQNPDTDGDGTPDGEEVDQNRNPILRANDDTLENEDYRAVAMVRQAVKKKDAPLLDPSAEPSAFWLPTLHLKPDDLKISALESETALKNYGASLAKALTFYTTPLTENEVALTLEILESNNELALSQLGQLVERHINTLEELRAITVPQSATELHLALLNTIGGLAEAGINMSTVLREPVLALQSAELYPARHALLLGIFEGFNQYFSERDIAFSPQDQITIDMFRLSKK